jgi:hypothetical protein
MQNSPAVALLSAFGLRLLRVCQPEWTEKIRFSLHMGRVTERWLYPQQTLRGLQRHGKQNGLWKMNRGHAGISSLLYRLIYPGSSTMSTGHWHKISIHIYTHTHTQCSELRLIGCAGSF